MTNPGTQPPGAEAPSYTETWRIYVCACGATALGSFDCDCSSGEYEAAAPVELVEASALERERARSQGLENAASFALAAIPSKHPEPCGTDACWLCAAETTLREALGLPDEEGEEKLKRVPSMVSLCKGRHPWDDEANRENDAYEARSAHPGDCVPSPDVDGARGTVLGILAKIRDEEGEG